MTRAFIFHEHSRREYVPFIAIRIQSSHYIHLEHATPSKRLCGIFRGVLFHRRPCSCVCVSVRVLKLKITDYNNNNNNNNNISLISFVYSPLVHYTLGHKNNNNNSSSFISTGDNSQLIYNTLPWLAPRRAALRYVMYFRFYG